MSKDATTDHIDGMAALVEQLRRFAEGFYGQARAAQETEDREWLKEAAHMAATLDKAADALARAAADTARLDWLDAHPHGLAIRHAERDWRVPDYDSLAVNHRGATLREAIDAARKAQEPR